ncbi:MAG: hypothetical protein ACYSWO_07285 [Planctomycetota bacterium]|jgi:hypothetical protein
MEDRNRENLAELLGRFFDAEQVESCLEDVRETERMLADNPAPAPDDMLLADIKAEITMRLPARRAQLARHRTYRRAAVAAAIVIVAAISVTLFNAPPQPAGLVTASLIPAAIWESDNIAADDEDLAFFATEIEQIENEVTALESDQDASESDSTITDLEMELEDISTDFWKG